jgi:hypothetical protein
VGVPAEVSTRFGKNTSAVALPFLPGRRPRVQGQAVSPRRRLRRLYAHHQGHTNCGHRHALTENFVREDIVANLHSNGLTPTKLNSLPSGS